MPSAYEGISYGIYHGNWLQVKVNIFWNTASIAFRNATIRDCRIVKKKKKKKNRHKAPLLGER